MLGLMGIGVAASASDGTGLGTTAATTTAPAASSATTLAVWGDEADKLCATASCAWEAGYPTTLPEQAGLFFERYLDVYRDLDNISPRPARPRVRRPASRRCGPSRPRA